MEAFFLFLLFVFVIVIFIILLSFKSAVSFKQKLILRRMDELKNDLASLKKVGIEVPLAEKQQVIQKEKIVEEKPVVETQKTEEKEVKTEQPEIVQQPIEKEPEKEHIHKETKVEQPIKEPVAKTVTQQAFTKTKPIQKPKKKTDFEKFIGENLLNKIGIVILVLAMIFFGKYAVDEGWLNDTAKVVAIVLIGGVLIGIAHKLRTNYKAFSSVLAGGGIASLYISIAMGFQLYGLFSQTAAFLILVVITILAILLSLAYDKQELAVIAIFGGFATPLMVSTGEGNYKVLFTYILILDIGMLVLSYYKKWNVVNFVANFATLILFAAWILDAHFNKQNLPHLGALLFVTAFYLVFFLMNIINNIKENAKFTAFEFLMLVTNTFLYFWAGMFIVNDYQPAYNGLFTVCLAMFNFAFAYPLYRNKQIDKNLIFLLIGLVLTFASITIPVQFEGKYITMFWAAEAVLLLWLSQKSGIILMKIASFIVSFFMVISLVMDWIQIYLDRPYDAEPLSILLNEGFITGVVAVIAFFLIVRLLQNEARLSGKVPSSAFSNLFIIGFIISLYIIFQLELYYQIDRFYNDSYLTTVALAFYNYLYVAVILGWASIKKVKYILEGITIISVIALLVYVSAVLPSYKKVINYYLMDEIAHNFSLLHFTTGLVVLVICYFLWVSIKSIYKNQKSISDITLWFSVAIGVAVLSVDLDYLVLLGNMPELTQVSDLIRKSHLVGWPILWGVLAFILMILGMKQDEKMFRIIGISLFFLVILKLFIIDVWGMSQGGRVAAFASLAVLLLVISFLYQKLKKIIFEDDKSIDETPAEEENHV